MVENNVFMKNQKKLIIFDLDGTLYELRGGSFKKSSLQRRVIKNAQNFIATRLAKSNFEAQRILSDVQKQYGEEISIGLEKEFGLNRYDYFNTVWNISARRIVNKEPGLRRSLLILKKTYNLALVSDAPLVWINSVFKELKIRDLFGKNIFSGEGNRRKGFSNAFSSVTRELKVRPSNCIVVGDQEETDIIPAKKLGMLSVFINRRKRSRVADINIKSISELSLSLEVFSRIVPCKSKRRLS